MGEHDLSRFETAQADVYDRALQEIRAGRKRSHWMWFIFPQVTGLGFSEMSVHFAIGTLQEANAYLAHPTLSGRLREMTDAMNANSECDPARILGAVDAKKFQSSMTLFNSIAPNEDCFQIALDKFFAGRADQETLRRVEEWGRSAH